MSTRRDRLNHGNAGPTGVDGTLIDEMLRMTPRQRLQQNDRMAALAVQLEAAFESGSVLPLKRRSTDAKDRLQLAILEETLRRRATP